MKLLHHNRDNIGEIKRRLMGACVSTQQVVMTVSVAVQG